MGSLPKSYNYPVEESKSVINLTHASFSLSFVRTKLNHEASLNLLVKL